MTTQVRELDEQLSAFFDDELEGSASALVEAELARDEDLAASLADLSFMREMVVGDLEHQAERVPEARFEQIWDAFEATVERESRLQEAAEAPPALWDRFVAWVRPLRVPLAAVGAAAVLAVVFAKSVGFPDDPPEDDVAANTPERPASDQPAPDEDAAAQPSKSTPPERPIADQAIAVAPDPEADTHPEPEMFPEPEPGEAEIRHIEFGGRGGTVTQVEGTRGTTTVIWVTEDDAPVDTERSL